MTLGELLTVGFLVGVAGLILWVLSRPQRVTGGRITTLQPLRKKLRDLPRDGGQR